ncbi:hypothetical protein ACFWNN_15710 [Lentzea sp. NPDC058450]|uniref:hypothetical protein n=1 Tax=Lentzea sp. NPDC058450 TaxID=3346505 RepID=UPI0036549C40
MVEGLGAVDWSALRNHGGYGDQVPVLLREVGTSRAAGEELLDLLIHGEFDVTEAAAAAWPFLLELVTCEETPRREWILSELCAAIALNGGGGGHDVHPSWHVAWEAAKPALLALLGSPDLCRPALHVLSRGRGDSAPVLPALSRLWAAETDRVTRLSVVFTAAEFAGHGDVAAVDWLAALRVPEDEPEAAMLVSAAARPDAAVLVRGLNADLRPFYELFEMNYADLLAHLRWLLGDDPAELTGLWLALLQHPSWRTEALDGLLTAVRTWRSAEPRVRPLLAGWLADPDPRSRRFAVEVAGGLRAAEHADAVAELLTDGTEISARHRIGDVAAWALARCGRPAPATTWPPPDRQGYRDYDPATLSLDETFPPKRMRAWYEHWRRTGEVGELERLALAEVERWRGRALGEDGITAVRHLVELGVRVPRRDELLASDHRLGGGGSWQGFDEGEDVRGLLERS